MICPSRPLAGALALFVFCAGLQAQDDTKTAKPKPLSPEEVSSAVKVDALSIPTPGELMAALQKVGKPDWTGQYRAPIATTFTSRPQMALNLGGLIADGYIAVEAEDAQQVKNIGRDIISLAKPLGVQQDIINRGKSLTEFAENGQWNVLKEELEATQNEVKAALIENGDQDLVTLVTVGGWIRGTEVITSYLSDHYSKEGAKLIRQPGIARFLYDQLNGLPDKVRDDHHVKRTRNKLQEIEQTVSVPPTATPPPATVKRLHELASELVKDISTKEK